MKPAFLAVTLIASCLHYLMFRPHSFMTAFKLYFFVIHVGVVSLIRGIKLISGQPEEDEDTPPRKKAVETPAVGKYEKQVGCAHFAIGNVSQN